LASDINLLPFEIQTSQSILQAAVEFIEVFAYHGATLGRALTTANFSANCRDISRPVAASITCDAFFTQLMTSADASTPSVIGTPTSAPETDRGRTKSRQQA
jgi:hypothetical protein